MAAAICSWLIRAPGRVTNAGYLTGETTTSAGNFTPPPWAK